MTQILLMLICVNIKLLNQRKCYILNNFSIRFQLWCAAGVNLSGGKTRDGGSIVGASVFYSDVSASESPKKKVGSQSSLEKLDQELKVRPYFCSMGRLIEPPF